ncbi:TetR/AcrR family transcriptional regulator [Nocardia veterana]|uniref:TetR/AcrR family transcriptional regulator n=1 Tax=Nocardia veterana TaxID=132249 RepID=A0A7X6LYZ9_9NOCA|nr:TetR/AcrR family transcriptional regulator [Nocardia veterana]NKY87193.1 TetR/AcrR family transcriptional regulator [Nocardia veterana]
MPSRRRLTPEQRRDELMDVGARIFGERAYDEIAMEDIAAQAGASRALVYHYFPTKGEFFAAIWKRAHDRLLADVRMIADEPVRTCVYRALVAHLDFYRDHIALVLIANRSALATDPAVRGPVTADLNALCERVLDACGAAGHPREVAGAALTGWIAFVREVAIEWLTHQRISRDEVIRMCMAALDATAGVQLDLTAPPRTSAGAGR